MEIAGNGDIVQEKRRKGEKEERRQEEGSRRKEVGGRRKGKTQQAPYK
jgi:hypothetical protein